ncbi:MAG: hypothetical protein HY701_10720 [Gemmatimonadetes bacterium]|nr:hypothetical protein [Gemmatimonadota bacterium]
MRVVSVPHSLDYRTVDQLVAELRQAGESRVLFDARHVRWVDPYGMLGLLAAGTILRDRDGSASRLQLPPDGDVTSYLGRMGFFEQARSIFEFEVVGAGRRASASSDVLLEITPVTSHGDVHEVVDRVQERAGLILSRTLGYPSPAVVQFSVLLSEVCQNIIEHADAPGWVAAQTYHWTKRLGRHVLVLAVVDLGIGFTASLAAEHAERYGARWGDAAALEAAFLHGATRFHDSGRGQGIQQIRKQVQRWGGKFSVRSGTARIADVPEWDESPTLEEELPPLPGSQICIILPARSLSE